MRLTRLPAHIPAELPLGSSQGGQGPTTSTSFAKELKGSLGAINALQQGAEQAMAQGAVDGAGRISDTMIQIEEAELSLRLLVKLRSKALEAYQEIMRLQF